MYKDGLVEFDAVLAIARRGSFGAAALELGLSTTALSNVIAKLERQLGVRLFNRTTRSVALTDAGRKFVDQVGPVVRLIHDAMDIARSQQETPSGTLRINAFPTAARQILGPLLLQFLRRYPQVHVDLLTEGRIVDIVAEGFDLGLRSADLLPSHMIAIPVGPLRSFAFVASAPIQSPRQASRPSRPAPPCLPSHPASKRCASPLVIREGWAACPDRRARPDHAR